jgi:shikimate kinase
MRKSVVLIGPGCSGKTSIGEELAKILGVEFIDADELFVEVFKKSIDEFIKENDQEIFRAYETKLLAKIREEYAGTQIVLIPGREAVVHDQGDKYRDENRENLDKIGTAIYLLPTRDLEESARILHARMQADQQTAGQRPAFEEMLKTVKERHRYYKEVADGLLYTKGKTVQEIAKELSIAFR